MKKEWTSKGLKIRLLSRNSIGNILNGRNSPKIETMNRIAEALEIDLSDLFKASREEAGGDPDGFIDYKGQIHRIKTVEEFKNLYETIFGDTVQAAEPEDVSAAKDQVGLTLGSLMVKGKSKYNVNKLQRRVFERFHVTLSNRKELEYRNNLPRDAKIWVFRSKQEEMEARKFIQNKLNYRFNT